MVSSVLTVLSLAAAAAAAIIPASGTAAGSAACTNPVVRKEWRELTAEEKADYLKAAVCVRNLPKKHYAAAAAVTSRMDDLTWTHLQLDTEIHFVANFLPWHRWFVQFHESVLRTECGYTGAQPYWDWTQDADANNVANAPVFAGGLDGFGGNGVRTGNETPGFQKCVVDGPFANSTVTIGNGWPDVALPGDRPHCFVRDFNNGGFTDENGDLIVGDMQASAYNSLVMSQVYSRGTYDLMQDILQGLPHAQVHSAMFGDMGPATSPTEPLFMLHHANVDRVWAKWQGRNATRLADYTGFNDHALAKPASLEDKMPVMDLLGDAAAPVVKDYMDIMADNLCYTYSSM